MKTQMKLQNNSKLLLIDKQWTEAMVFLHVLNTNNHKKEAFLDIEIKKDIKALIIEVFVNFCEDGHFIVKRNIKLGKNSSLDYLKIQDISISSSLNLTYNINQKSYSTLDITNFELGDGLIKNSFFNTLNKIHAKYNISSLVKLSNKASCTNTINTIHNAKYTSSDIKYKHCLDDNAKAFFKAKSIVNNTASFAKAFQDTKTILLSNNSQMHTQPHLEILIDELKASHGATTGSLDEEELLYLQARGIKKELAYDILLRAYEKEIYDNIKNKELKQFAKQYKRDNYV